MSMKRIALFASALLWIALTGCSGNKSNTTDGENTAGVSVQVDTASVSGIPTEDEFEFMLPTPSEVLSIVLTSGLSFHPDFMAPPGIEKRCIMVRHKALILGTYFADFAYTRYYSKRELATDYFKSVQELSADLGIASILNDVYFNRFDANISNPDSLDAIFEDFAQNAYNTIIESGNKELLSMISIGAAVEVLHIGVNSIESAVNKEEAVAAIIDNKAVFDNYYGNFVAYNRDKAEFKPMLNDLGKINSFLNNRLKSEKAARAVADGDNHFTIRGGETSKLSKEDLIRLKEMIAEVRVKLITLKY